MKCATCGYDESDAGANIIGSEKKQFIEINSANGHGFDDQFGWTIHLYACPKCKTVRID